MPKVLDLVLPPILIICTVGSIVAVVVAVAMARFDVGVLLAGNAVLLATGLLVLLRIRALARMARRIRQAQRESTVSAPSSHLAGAKLASAGAVTVATPASPATMVRSGSVLVGRVDQALPVIGFLVLGSQLADARDSVRWIAREQLITAGFKPVVVLDHPHFSVVRPFGFVSELLLTPEGFEGEDYQRYVESRLKSMTSTYGCAGFVPLNPSQDDSIRRALIAACRSSSDEPKPLL